MLSKLKQSNDPNKFTNLTSDFISWLPTYIYKDKKRTLQKNLCGDEYTIAFLIFTFFNITSRKT